jgi:hypothetical protein
MKAKLGVVRSSETSVHVRATRRSIPGDGHIRECHNLFWYYYSEKKGKILAGHVEHAVDMRNAYSLPSGKPPENSRSWLSLLSIVQSGIGTYPAFYSGTVSFKEKRPEHEDDSLPCSARSGLAELYLHSAIRLHVFMRNEFIIFAIIFQERI